MKKDLKEAYSIDNLHRAWRWLNTNSNGFYKNYFRHIYRAYAISIDDNLKDLRARLTREIFLPTHATKIYLPKKSGLQRTYTLLSVEDQIVYQALTNIVAERLFPKVKKRYGKEVFGHLYAGQISLFFYKDWRKYYKKFGARIRDVYSKGFTYSASFDLTACYDSIDHSVLENFLLDLGLQKEFVFQLCSYLKHWSANPEGQSIYHGHGIPQGPLASGLISEVVLRYFDEQRSSKPRAWRYFRYVDDIRFFAKSEHDLRAMIVEMDLLSKQIGLFPQSGKIDIHKVTNIEDEIKSISHPPEIVVRPKSPNPEKVFKRLIELSPRYKVSNETRFKYVLGGAEPFSKLSYRLIAILKKQPHLYPSIFNYFKKYQLISKKVSEDLLTLLKENDLYMALTASGLQTLKDRIHPDLYTDLVNYANKVIINSQDNLSPELRAAATAILLSSGLLSWEETTGNFSQFYSWWYRSELLEHVPLEKIGKPSYESLINSQLPSKSVDLSVIAAELISVNALSIHSPIDQINPTAQLTLKKLGIIKVRRGGPCPISISMQELFGTSLKKVDWKKILGVHYKSNIAKVHRLRAYFETDATAWVNLLDTIHDDLLDSLFANEGGRIGNYTHGNIGSMFNSIPGTSRFARKFPISYKNFHEIHQKRLESSLSHSITRRTGKRTRFIEHEYIEKVIPKVAKAYLEISDKW